MERRVPYGLGGHRLAEPQSISDLTIVRRAKRPFSFDGTPLFWPATGNRAARRRIQQAVPQGGACVVGPVGIVTRATQNRLGACRSSLLPRSCCLEIDSEVATTAVRYCFRQFSIDELDPCALRSGEVAVVPDDPAPIGDRRPHQLYIELKSLQDPSCHGEPVKQNASRPFSTVRRMHENIPVSTGGGQQEFTEDPGGGLKVGGRNLHPSPRRLEDSSHSGVGASIELFRQ